MHIHVTKLSQLKPDNHFTTNTPLKTASCVKTYKGSPVTPQRATKYYYYYLSGNLTFRLFFFVHFNNFGIIIKI
jgi:hypothetical protein